MATEGLRDCSGAALEPPPRSSAPSACPPTTQPVYFTPAGRSAGFQTGLRPPHSPSANLTREKPDSVRHRQPTRRVGDGACLDELQKFAEQQPKPLTEVEALKRVESAVAHDDLEAKAGVRSR